MVVNFLKHNKYQLLLLTFLVFIAYVNSLGNEFVSDDIIGIMQNPAIKEFSFVLQPFGIPRNILYFLNTTLFGVTPWIFRFENILFHLGSVFLVYGLIKVLTKSPRASIISAGLVAIHPLLSEAIVWISGGAYVQYAFFILLSLLFYILKDQGKRFYLYSILAYFFALQSHGIALIFPALIWIYDLSFRKVQWRSYLPFIILTIIWTISGYFVILDRSHTLQTVHYQEGGLDNPLVLIPISISNYLRLIILPTDLTIYHSELSYSTWQYILMILVAFAYLGLIIWGYFKNKFIFFWSSFFLIVLSPTLTPLRVNWIVAERYVYLAAIGPLIILGYLANQIIQKFKSNQIIYVAITLILIGFLAKTITRNMDWSTADNLWLSAASTSPSSPNNHNNLGDLYGRRGDINRAIQEFQIAIKLKPNYGDAYHNLGNAYSQANQLELAQKSYLEAIKYNPNLWQSYQNLAAIYFAKNNFEEAIKLVNQAIKISPYNPGLRISLGIIYLKQGDKLKAKESFQQALQLDPTNHIAQQGLTEAGK